MINIFDVAVVVFLLTSLVRGAQIGFIRQLFSTLGFVIGIFIGLYVANFASVWVSDTGGKTLLSTILLFVFGFGVMTVGESIGANIKQRLASRRSPNLADNIFGTLLSAVTCILALWFITAFLALLPLGGVQKIAKQSYSFNVLDRHLPPASELLSGLNHYFRVNDAPLAFSGREPAPDRSLQPPLVANYEDVFKQVDQSVVRIQGLGCGGLANGSGIILSPTRVLTNAHVVAGIANPTVYDSDGSHNAKVVLFDTKLDLAVLAIEKLSGKPAIIATKTESVRNPVLIIGYPGGGALKNDTGIIADRVNALGRDIYGQSKTVRDVYVIYATIIPGNSGGPVLNEKGEVTGIVFGASTQYTDVGYALTLDQIKPTIDAASKASQPQKTGACSEL